MQDYRGFLKGKATERAELTTQSDRLTMACFGGELGADVDLIYNEKRKRTEVHFYVTSGTEFKREFRAIGVFYLNEDGKITKF